MVTQKERRYALDYIAGVLENSGYYACERKTEGGLLLEEKNRERAPQHIEIVIPNGAGTVDEVVRHCYDNMRKKIFTVPIFYKDGKTAFVRMAERNQAWRSDKSLKQYTEQQINEMVHLRAVEKKILDFYEIYLNVTYFQPQTERLEEGLRRFRFEPVVLDYSHILREDPRSHFVQDRESIDYKLPKDLGRIQPAGTVSLIYRPPFLGNLVSAPTKITIDSSIDAWGVEEELADNARRAYPGLDREEALKVYLNEEDGSR